MCGIAGWIGALPQTNHYAEQIGKALSHRGPDGQGTRLWREAGLIHTRLSILDLSESGAQPMSNEAQSIWSVVNGEIYNHKELQDNLENKGHRFLGHSDSEVIPHLYEEQGLEFLPQLRGMFALAVYHPRTKTLVLARDRFGIKPLFYAKGNNRLMFSSEINALRQFPDIDDQPDPQAISDLTALFYIPAPQTFFKGIRALQPGEMLIARLESDKLHVTIQPYYQWVLAPNPKMTLEEAIERVDSLVREGVSRQMESDVPLGSLLSGGIDSSLVSFAAQASKGDLRTFNVQFQDKGFDETWAAVEMAKHIGSEHVTLDMNGVPGTWEHITEMLNHLGQPFADTSIFAVNAVCQKMRQHVTVALSGDGGDEGFGGYNFYNLIDSIGRWQSLPAWVWRGASSGLQPFAQIGMISDRLPQRLRDIAGANETQVIENVFSWVRRHEHQRLVRNLGALPVGRLFESQWKHNLSSKPSRLERLFMLATEANIRLMLPNDFLYKVDMGSMKEGLEVRVPMLDEDLLDFAMYLPHNLKVKKGMSKRVLRGIAQRWLPPKIAKKRKCGFEVPVDKWVDRNFKTQLKDLLLGPSSKLSEFFNPEMYRPMVEAFVSGNLCPEISRQGLYQRVIMLLSVQLALDSRSM